MNMGYGGYTCIENVCNFVVHSYCATRRVVWDGKDVEGEPIEASNSKVDTAPFVEVNGGNICHFSHEHELMRLQSHDQVESGKLCQACILPLDFSSFFSCKQCDFALHEACAHLPNKLEHMLHRHSLTLEVNYMMKIREGFFTCSICNQDSCGFMYRCFREECGFKIDVKCASFVEPFNHPAHSKPLYLKQFGDDQIPPRCHVCNQYSQTMASDQIYFLIDFKCVTLPRLARYKYDTHPLTLYRLMQESWCEICENRINKHCFVYICKDCYTVLHVECVFGSHRYLKSGHMIKVEGLDIQIASNNSVSRPICHKCHCHCHDKLIFINMRDNMCFCSIKCIHPTNDGPDFISPLKDFVVRTIHAKVIESGGYTQPWKI